jgi:hypothetical protein
MVCIFDPISPRISAYEIHEWIHEQLQVSEQSLTVIQIEGIKRLVFMKSVNDTYIQNILQSTNVSVEYRYTAGEISIVRLEVAGTGMRVIRLANLPTEVTESNIRLANLPPEVTESNIRLANLPPEVTESNIRLANLPPEVTESNIRLANMPPEVTESNIRLANLPPEVTESNNRLANLPPEVTESNIRLANLPQK